MFVVLAKKLGTTLAPADVPPIPQRGAVVGRGHRGDGGARAAQVAASVGANTLRGAALADVVAQFLPSTQGLEKELQETAAIIECTDREFLPPPMSRKWKRPAGAQRCKNG